MDGKPHKDNSSLDAAVAAVRTLTVPEDVAARVIDKATGLASSHQLIPAVRRDVRQPRRRIAAQGVCLVTAALLLVVTWSLLPRSVAHGWDDIVAAVQQTEWIHGVWTGPSGEKCESWSSGALGIDAMTFSGQVVFDDHRLGIRSHYDAAQKHVIQTPLNDAIKVVRGDTAAIFKAVLQGGSAAKTSTVRVTKYERREFQEDGQSKLEVGFVMSLNDLSDELHCRFLVDPVTHLPTSCTLSGAKLNGIGNYQDVTIRFDYPQEGPRTIHALGVKADVPVDNRVPAPELTRIVAGMRAACERFDPYSAVVVERLTTDTTTQPSNVYQVWRDGMQWRLERWHQGWTAGPETDSLTGETRIDQELWWKKWVDGEKFIPILLQDGQKSYRFKTAYSPVTEDGRIDVLGSHAIDNVTSMGRADRVPSNFRAFPEFQSRPEFGIGGSETLGATLDPNPTSGPQGCVLVEVRYRHQPPRPQSVDLMRAWVDPTKDYVVMQWEAMHIDDGIEQKLSEHHVVSLAQSPQGLWYPTAMRFGEGGDAITEYYLDFTSPVPENRFRLTPEEIAVD